MTATLDPIAHELIGQGFSVAEAMHEALHKLMKDHPDATATDLVGLAVRSAYSVGIEMGLAVAVHDIANGRRLLDWLTANVQVNDPYALDERAHHLAAWNRILDAR